MVIKYGEYKELAWALYDFINPKSRNNEDEEQEIREYLENNMTVDMPDKLYVALADYKTASNTLNDAITNILNEKIKARRAENKRKKKPVIIEAIQWTGNNYDEVKAFIGNNANQAGYNNLHIFTLEGVMTASAGDYIIKGVKGEFYPCKPDIFNETYEPAE